MKITKNIRKAIILGILGAITVFIVFTASNLMTVPIGCPDAIVFETPEPYQEILVNTEFVLRLTIDPALTTVPNTPIIRGYEISWENKDDGTGDFICKVDSFDIDESYLTKSIYLEKTITFTTTGNYSIMVFIHVGDATDPEFEVTTFYNYIKFIVFEEPTTEDTNTETGEETVITPSFSVIALVTIPIILIWRKHDE